MSAIHVFKGLSEKETFNFTGKLSDNINLDWNKCIILKSGYCIDKDYVVRDDDIIFIRCTPSGTAAIVVGVLAVTIAGVSAGVSIYKTKKQLAMLEEAQRASKETSKQSEKLPFIKGARNRVATGQSFPYAIGESLMSPYLLCPPHYTIAGTRGEDQYYNAVLEIAYNDILLKKLKMGETVIKNFADTTPQNGQYSFDDGLYYDARNLIEIRQTGTFEDEEFNKKIVLTELNKEIPHRHASTDPEENRQIEKEWRAGVVQDLASHTQAVELIILFDGLQVYDDGSWRQKSITLKTQWTNKDNPTESDWINFDHGFNQNGSYNNTFTYNTRKQMRFIARQDFTAAQAFEKQLKVRIIRTTPKEESSARDTVYIVAVQSHCYDAKKSTQNELVPADVLEPTERDKCCRIGVRIAATQSTDGLLDSISVIESACARTWNGTEWSETKQPTRNLAAWVLEILTSPHHKPSQYKDEEIDLESFGAWYEYCNNQGFYADGIVSKTTKKKTLIETLCKNGNAALVYNNITGKIEVAIDNGRDYSVALLNSDNIISISTAKDFKRKSTGKKVKYVNAAAGYDADSVIFMRDGEDYDPTTDTLTETALEYVTTHQHAYKIAWRQMAEETAQPRVVTVKTGLESAYYPLYSRIELQHKSLKKGITHAIIKKIVWKSGLLKEIQLDSTVEFPELIACGVIINAVNDNGHGVLYLKVSGTGKTDTLQVESILRFSDDIIPVAGNSLSFGCLDVNGEFTTIIDTMKITNAVESDDGYTLTLVDYNPELYNYGPLPVYKSNLTTVPTSSKVTIESQRDYATIADTQTAATESVQSIVDTITSGVKYTNVYKVRSDGTNLEDIIAKIDDDARNVNASISMSADEILLQVNDVERELIGLVDIQAGAVMAMVEGGGATGQLSLSINLPTMITEETRDKLIQASSLDKVNAVYAAIEGTEFYGIKGNASSTALKILWDDAVNGKLLASQLVLQADQIYIDGDVILNDEKKIKAALIEVENILTKNISLKEKGVIHSDNYNGTIDENGVITEYGDAGWAIDHEGNSDFVNINSTGGKFKNGFFSGLLDCGVFQVTNAVNEWDLIFYSKDDAYTFRQYMIDKWGLSYDYEGPVSGIYGADTYLEIEGVLYPNIRVHILENRAVNISIGVPDGPAIFTAFGSVTTITNFYHDFHIVYYKYGTVININDLPTTNPHVKGRAWLSGDTVKISQG